MIASLSFAQGGDARKHFDAGRAAFEAQNYAAALEAFEAALAAGMAGPAVHFNIGVAAFRLGRYSRSETAFKQAARTPTMAALAHYNLGLVARRAGSEQAAARWFSLAEREAGDERLRALAASQSAQLIERRAGYRADRNWLGYGSFAAGYDDNVALLSDSDVLGVTGTQDGFNELQLAFAVDLGEPWRIDAGMLRIDYQELNGFDQLAAYGGGRYRFDAGAWSNELRVQVARTTLDGEGFESKRTLALQTAAELGPQWRARARYRLSDIDGLNAFEGLSGRSHEASARFDWQRAPWNLRLEYRFEISKLDDEALSNRRQLLGAELQRELAADWTLALEVARLHSRYEPASHGTEQRTELAAALTRELSARWRLNIRYAYANNAADIPAFDYQRSRISAGVELLL